MKIVGVDAGKKGAICFHDVKNKELSVIDLPLDSNEELDTHKLFSSLLEYEPRMIVIEDCWRPKSLNRMVGEVVAIAKILQVEIKVLAVCTWKKAMLGENTSDKQRSIKLCKKICPTVDLIKPGKRKVKESADRAEAILLTFYAKNFLI